MYFRCTVYAAPIDDIISAYGIQHHQYADDTQLFFALKAATVDTDIHLLESCSRPVKRWFLEYDLMLNDDKSEVKLYTRFRCSVAKDRWKQICYRPIVADVALPIVNHLKSLGVIVDSWLTFKSHANAVAKACNYHILVFPAHATSRSWLRTLLTLLRETL